jgi:V/A-type H+-transporting ATPase subunit K
MIRKVLFFAGVLVVMGAVLSFAQSESSGSPGTGTEASNSSSQSSLKYFAAALAVGISCIAGGIAVGQIGAAAMGAMSENPELSGKALPYVGLAEGICLWGFLVALFILLI